LPELNVFLSDHPLDSFERIYFIACGSSWHAAMAGRYYLEAIAKIPVSVELASEFRYREPFLNSRTLVVAISQSGETADTLACLEEARRFDAKIIAVCNVLESSIPRYSDVTLYTYAGPEISVASTKAFISQLLLLLLLALDWACRLRRRTDDYLERAIMALEHLPQQVENLLNRAEELKVMAGFLAPKTSAYFIARGVHYPIALEGSLKLKEISYIHAEGYPAGEMKHGPLALLESGFPVIALAPQDRVCEKMLSNIQESRARGATLLTFCTEGDKRFVEISDYLFEVPEVLWYIAPIILTVPLQLLSYYVAVARDCEVDQPRNLAKSVTVE
jgi:glucosamine--fructose-6-phosphate aminotransferase (isomerizing)